MIAYHGGWWRLAACSLLASRRDSTTVRVVIKLPAPWPGMGHFRRPRPAEIGPDAGAALSAAPPPPADYIKASEVGTYVFCHRAWRFERQGAPSSREPERARGTAYRVKQGERVASAARVGAAARAWFVLAVGLLLLGLWLSLR